MKKIYITIFVLLGTFSACDDELELKPQQDIDSEEAFKNEATTTGMLIGAYNVMQDLHVFGSQPQIIEDYVADNVNFVGSFNTLQQVNNFAVASDNGSIAEIWEDSYEAILQANLIIANVAGVDDDNFSEAERNKIIGEARFVRAICYFQLCNFFAQPFQFQNGENLAIPLITEPFTGEVLQPKRATVNQIHGQIEADLEEARNLLAEDGYELGRATWGAATALLSRLNLYRENWQLAADFAEEVMNGGVYSMAPDYEFYNEDNRELIFALQNITVDFRDQDDTGDVGGGSWDDYYEGVDRSGRGDAPFSRNLTIAFESEPGDKRYELRATGQTFSGPIDTFTTKYDNGLTNESDPALIRFTEMMLNRAEAIAQMEGINLESLNEINKIRERAGLPMRILSDFADKEAFLEGIATERRKELCFEGHRRMDLLRTRKPLRTLASIPASITGDPTPFLNVTVGNDRAIFPIPLRELEVNPELLPQNPGY